MATAVGELLEQALDRRAALVRDAARDPGDRLPDSLLRQDVTAFVRNTRPAPLIDRTAGDEEHARHSLRVLQTRRQVGDDVRRTVG